MYKYHIKVVTVHLLLSMRDVSSTLDSKGCNLSASEIMVASLSFTVILLALLSEGGDSSIPNQLIASRHLRYRLLWVLLNLFD